jgi:hypothetical protein
MKTLLTLALLLSAGPVLAQTKTQTQPPQPAEFNFPPGWLLCMNPEIARHARACQIFVWDGPPPVLGASQ